MSEWPALEVDPVARLRALAASLPHVFLDECEFDAPFERAWSVIADLEGAVPRYESGVRSAEILNTTGERLELRTVGPFGASVRFDVVLRSGWCIMRSRFADVGMAAVPTADGRCTRFAHFEGSRLLGRAGRPLFRRRIRGDFARLARLIGAEHL